MIGVVVVVVVVPVAAAAGHPSRPNAAILIWMTEVSGWTCVRAVRRALAFRSSLDGDGNDVALGHTGGTVSSQQTLHILQLRPCKKNLILTNKLILFQLRLQSLFNYFIRKPLSKTNKPHKHLTSFTFIGSNCSFTLWIPKESCGKYWGFILTTCCRRGTLKPGSDLTVYRHKNL